MKKSMFPTTEQYERWLEKRKVDLEAIKDLNLHESLKLPFNFGMGDYYVVTRVPGGFLYVFCVKNGSGPMTLSTPYFAEEVE